MGSRLHFIQSNEESLESLKQEHDSDLLCHKDPSALCEEDGFEGYSSTSLLPAPLPRAESGSHFALPHLSCTLIISPHPYGSNHLPYPHKPGHSYCYFSTLCLIMNRVRTEQLYTLMFI